jgi:hypothetical protein
LPVQVPPCFLAVPLLLSTSIDTREYGFPKGLVVTFLKDGELDVLELSPLLQLPPELQPLVDRELQGVHDACKRQEEHEKDRAEVDEGEAPRV